MRYELGDRVRISKHWKRQNRDEHLKLKGIEDLENYLMSDDMAGDYIHINKYSKDTIDEVGFITGMRYLKVSYDLQYLSDQPYVKDGVQQMDYHSERIYLVATKMNTLRRVSSEDIEFENKDSMEV